MTTSHISPGNNGHHAKGSYMSRTGTLVKSTYPKSVSNGNGNGNGTYEAHYSVRRPSNSQYSSSTSLQNEVANSGNTYGQASRGPSPLPASNVSYRSMPLSNGPYKSPTTPALNRINSSSNLKSMKRWSASQEFRLSSLSDSK